MGEYELTPVKLALSLPLTSGVNEALSETMNVEQVTSTLEVLADHLAALGYNPTSASIKPRMSVQAYVQS